MLATLTMLCVLPVFAEGPTALPAGTKLPPYSFLLSIGEQRGRSHCYVCESIEKPVLILFATAKDSRGNLVLSSPKTGQLARFLDEALANRENLASWVTFLNPKQDELDAPIVKWANETGLRLLPVGVFEDPLGPPAYRFNGKASMTAIVAKDGKVEKAIHYQEGESLADFQASLLKELDRIAPIKAKATTEKEKPKAEPEKKK